jgi:hypothetical protein
LLEPEDDEKKTEGPPISICMNSEKSTCVLKEHSMNWRE